MKQFYHPKFHGVENSAGRAAHKEFPAVRQSVTEEYPVHWIVWATKQSLVWQAWLPVEAPDGQLYTNYKHEINDK